MNGLAIIFDVPTGQMDPLSVLASIVSLADAVARAQSAYGLILEWHHGWRCGKKHGRCKAS